ncbi:LamG-like jellyroll fold domain-containing protein [Ferruginibacter sp. SUN106]|uniref:LamG-like jellyroll fold domain-containing protein n=1 Tax=Ferruginibacter sp. SUN106 TaxID=2978348 RepID=UPI003D360AB4
MKNFVLLLILCACLNAEGQINLNQGLIAYYPFNGNANDASGNGINGIVNNAILTTDRTGQPNAAYYFNGTSAFIQLPYSTLYNFAPADSFSISVRILQDQNNTNTPAQALVVKSPFNSNWTLSNWNYGIYSLNYKAMTGYANTTVLTGTTTFTGIPCWYNIVTTYKAGVWRLYVNGVLESQDLSATRFIIQDGASSQINFGRKGNSSGDWFKGSMDDIRIYNRVLNVNEIDALTDCPSSCEDSCNWSLTGNSNVQSWNFIGPKNNADFKIKTNNVQRMVVSAAGNVGINSSAPGSKLEIDATGLAGAVNDYTSPAPSTSGLRFTALKAGITAPIRNRFGGVLSLDEDGDVIWVQACCNIAQAKSEEMSDILNRLDKLEKEVNQAKTELKQMDVMLEKSNIVVLGQNNPNPFTERTLITYNIPKAFKSAYVVITSTNGAVVKKIEITNPGKGQLNVIANGISAGLYSYTLIIDDKTVESKKMIKQ